MQTAEAPSFAATISDLIKREHTNVTRSLEHALEFGIVGDNARAGGKAVNDANTDELNLSILFIANHLSSELAHDESFVRELCEAVEWLAIDFAYTHLAEDITAVATTKDPFDNSDGTFMRHVYITLKEA